ncbi:MAG: RNA-binding domain-containing protein [Candidatus Nezhaarchaeales archaeon]
MSVYVKRRDLPRACVYLEAFAHATEDVNKVIQAVLNVLPEEFRERVTPSTEKLEGYYGNAITVIRLTVEGEREVKAYLKALAEKLTLNDKAYLRSSLNARIDKGSFYLRLDKDEAYRGSLRIREEGTSIKVRITVKKIVEALKELKVL